MQTRVFPATDFELVNVIAFLEEELEKIDCPMKTVMQLSLCLEEIFVNVAHYSFPESEGSATISIDYKDEVFSIIVEDSGVPFNPLEKEDPDISLAAEDRRIGGLGIYLVKKTMDELSYEYKGNKNIFCMRKYLS